MVPLFLLSSIFASGHLKDRLQDYFHEVVENPTLDLERLSEYVSSDYTLILDGKRFTYGDYAQRLAFYKANEKSVKVIFERFVEEGNSVSTVHRAHIVKQDGTELNLEILAHFEFQGDKLIFCQELTRLLAD